MNTVRFAFRKTILIVMQKFGIFCENIVVSSALHVLFFIGHGKMGSCAMRQSLDTGCASSSDTQVHQALSKMKNSYIWT